LKAALNLVERGGEDASAGAPVGRDHQDTAPIATRIGWIVFSDN
jgi:hypothetical protein